MRTTYGYDGDTKICRLYNRDAENWVGFETRKLDMYESNQLANFMDKLYNDAYRAGQESLANKIRALLPPENGSDANS